MENRSTHILNLVHFGRERQSEAQTSRLPLERDSVWVGERGRESERERVCERGGGGGERERV